MNVLTATVGCQVPPLSRRYLRERELGFSVQSNERHPDNVLEGTLTEFVSLGQDAGTAAFRDAERVYAVAKAVKLQEAIGLDLISEGELSRRNYSIYLLENIDGIVVTDGTPRLVGTPAVSRHVTAEDYLLAARFASRPVKVTVPGPLTLAHRVTGGRHEKLEVVARALARCVSAVIDELYRNGCRHVQIDEPMFTTFTKEAVDFGFDLLDDCLSSRPGVQTFVHLCRNYPIEIDGDASNKAPHDAYRGLVDRLARSRVDVVSIEDATAHNSPDVLRALANKVLMLGVCNIGSRGIDPIEQIVARLTAVLRLTARTDIILAPDCGFLYLDYETANAKMLTLVGAKHALLAHAGPR